jgi:invasion protein IalB
MEKSREGAYRSPRIIAAVLAGGLISLSAAPASAQGVVKSVHGEWQIRCDTLPGAQSEQCALIQSVTAEDRPNVGLTVIVLKTADQKNRLMRVLAPLGVLLPAGLGLIIDSELNEPNPLTVQRNPAQPGAAPASVVLTRDAKVPGGIGKGDALLYCQNPTPGGCWAAPKIVNITNANGRLIELESDPAGLNQMQVIGHRRQAGRALFVRCLPNGCVAEVIMDDNVMKELRGAQTATFTIFQTPEEGIGIPLSLKGFGEGFDKLP